VVEFASAILAHVVDSGRSLAKFGGKKPQTDTHVAVVC
jgi:hypothetical protein